MRLGSGDRPLRALIGVAVCYFLVQVLATSHMRLGWDETVYVSQVSRFVPSAFFSAPRARGITWLVAPIVLVTPSVLALRVYLAVLSSVALVVCFGTWLAVRRDATVPLAAGLFAALWTALFYGSEAMPNLWVAFAAIAATGCLVLAARNEPRRGPVLGLVVAVVVASLMRPPDGLALAAALAVTALALRRPALAGVVAGAVALGWLPWAIEAVTSYGGPAARLARASQIQGGTHLQFAVDLQLWGAHRGLCRPCPRTGPFPIVPALWWATGLALLAVGLVASRPRRPLVVASCVALVVASPYLFLLGYAAARFLLPAYGLAVLPIAAGALALWRTPLRALAVLVVAAHVSYQLAVLWAAVRSNDRQREGWARIAEELRPLGLRPPCVLSGPAAPPIAFYAGCDSRQVGGNDASISADGLRRLSRRVPVGVLAATATVPSAVPPAWSRHPLGRINDANWTVYVAPPP